MCSLPLEERRLVGDGDEEHTCMMIMEDMINIIIPRGALIYITPANSLWDAMVTLQCHK